MKANYSIDAGDVRVIRPLVYVREKATRDFSKSSRLPVVNENCPACFEEPKERARVKKLLSQEEAMVPALFFNLRKALLPLMHDKTYEAIHEVEKLVELQSSKRAVVKRTRSSVTDERNAIGDDEDEMDDMNTEQENRERETKKTRSSAEEAVEVAEKLMTTNSSVSCDDDDYCAPCYELM
jgi:tRNA(Ile)-lysidine synthase TilS/MesJ